MSKKIDLSDVSAVIPIRIDHPDRTRNLDAVMRYFEASFVNYELIIIERSLEQNCQFLEDSPNVNYEYIKDGELLHRTKMLNDGMKKSTRKFVASYDCDVAFVPSAIHDTLQVLREGKSIYVLPYNGVSIDIQKELRNNFMTDFDFSILPCYEPSIPLYTKGPNYEVVHNRGLGGAVFFEKEQFLANGGYNEKFISWGWEDNELFSRFTTLGYPIARIGGKINLYHFNHHRHVDSVATHAKAANNQNELRKVTSMNRDQLRNYVKTELRK